MSINDWSKSLVNRSLGLFRLMNQAADSSRRKEQHDEVPKRNIVKKKKKNERRIFWKRNSLAYRKALGLFMKGTDKIRVDLFI